MIVCGCLGLGLWYREQFLGRLQAIRGLICILEQWSSEVRYNRSTLPECCLRIGRHREDHLGQICAEVYEEYTAAEGCGFLEMAEASFRKKLNALPLKKDDIDSFLIFTGREGYTDETMQIRALELAKQELERMAEMQQKEIRQKCRLSVGLGAMSGMLIVILLI